MFDHALIPYIKDLALQRDIFTFEDPSPIASGASYVVRGTMNGTAGSSAPISNPTAPLGPIDEGVAVLVKASRAGGLETVAAQFAGRTRRSQ